MDELRREIKGEVLSPAPEMYSRDYGNIVRLTPRAVVLPETVEDVQAVVSFARRKGLRVVPRGHGCTGNGQALSDQIVLDMGRLTGFDVVSDGVISAGSGTPWGALQDRLVSMGLSNMVLTDYAAHTVGGTLSVGGYGQTSTLLGGQVDQVVALDVISGTGELIRATADGPNADLFKYTLCGLGQTGIIVGAHLKVRPLRRYTIAYTRRLPGDVPIAEVNESILGADPPWETGFAVCSVVPAGWEVVVGFEREHAPERLEEGWTVVENNYKLRYPMADALSDAYTSAHLSAGRMSEASERRSFIGDLNVPTSQAAPFYEKLKSLFNDPRFCPGLIGMVLRNARAGRRLPLAPMPDADSVNSVVPWCIVPPSMVDDYKGRYEEAIEACLQAGGRLYLYGYYPRSSGFFRRQLGGATFDTWRAVKERYDPGKILGSQLF